ncbi:NmrA domain-containing protein [Mycena chlorophos]|uniref:NmrA domain-containing protein n=1 Tax=Mycena chlorophos TaxID=658473 RepID=A0A8H6W5G7_MYCCL|nr:NmrA domain-containing protein [Mycena chlorophos]
MSDEEESRRGRAATKTAYLRFSDDIARARGQQVRRKLLFVQLVTALAVDLPRPTPLARVSVDNSLPPQLQFVIALVWPHGMGLHHQAPPVAPNMTRNARYVLSCPLAKCSVSYKSHSAPPVFAYAGLDAQFVLPSESRRWRVSQSFASDPVLTELVGYVGGVILSRFLDREHLDARITALVRSPDKVQKLTELSKSGTLKNEFVVVQGTHHDGPLVEKLASEADEVFSLADCDDLGAMELILAGMKKRFEATGVKPILFHMSGTGALGDKAKGMFASTKVYSDLDIASIESLPATQNHRNVDLAVVAADAAGYVSTYIVLPGVFFGVPRGRLADLGVQNMQNFAWVIMYRASIGARGAAGIMGEGKNLMSFVEVNESESVDMIDLLYDAIQAGTAPHGREGYYFIVTDIIALEQLTEIVETRAGPRRPWTQAELDLYMPGATSLQDFFGDNGVAVSSRGKEMGWKPVLGKEELLQSIRDEVAQWKEGN